MKYQGNFATCFNNHILPSRAGGAIGGAIGGAAGSGGGRWAVAFCAISVATCGTAPGDRRCSARSARSAGQHRGRRPPHRNAVQAGAAPFNAKTPRRQCAPSNQLSFASVPMRLPNSAFLRFVTVQVLCQICESKPTRCGNHPAPAGRISRGGELLARFRHSWCWHRVHT
jgi:hypothetical protein